MHLAGQERADGVPVVGIERDERAQDALGPQGQVCVVDGTPVLLDEALAVGDEGDVMYALRAIASARGGIASVAATAGLSRETLYRTLSRSGNPRLSTLLAVMRATGVRLKAVDA